MTSFISVFNKHDCVNLRIGCRHKVLDISLSLAKLNRAKSGQNVVQRPNWEGKSRDRRTKKRSASRFQLFQQFC